MEALQRQRQTGIAHRHAVGEAVAAQHHVGGRPWADAAAGEQRFFEARGGGAAQLREYFAGKRKKFTFPLAPRGTEFQQRVWKKLLGIQYGTTTTYGALAGELGNPNASRAVGLANGSNPIPIVIPCHRVIGSNGALTGFGGGLPIKSALLELERKQAQPALF